MAEPASGALSDEELRTLADVAHDAVITAVRDRRRATPEPADYPEALRRPGAVFVTLRRDGELRGCVGTMTPSMPLVQAAADRARAAAFDDPRFDAVRPGELEGLAVEVSVLSPMEPFTVDGYDELVRTLRPGVDGLLVEAGRHRATFLPVVWEELTDPADFVSALWRKAGLTARSWPTGIATWRYHAQHS
jgi:AmmeMemoRadiSam system protein A